MKSRLEALEGFLARDPADSFTRYALALEHASLGDGIRAIELLRETLERDPRYVPAYHQLGLLLHAAGKTEDAAAVYRRGIEMARAEKDMHAASEMTSELESLMEENE